MMADAPFCISFSNILQPFCFIFATTLTHQYCYNYIIFFTLFYIIVLPQCSYTFHFILLVDDSILYYFYNYSPLQIDLVLHFYYFLVFFFWDFIQFSFSTICSLFYTLVLSYFYFSAIHLQFILFKWSIFYWNHCKGNALRHRKSFSGHSPLSNKGYLFLIYIYIYIY